MTEFLRFPAEARFSRSIGVLAMTILLLTLLGCRRVHVVLSTLGIAKTKRRDINIVMVIDRSGSLKISGSCAPLMTAVAGFVNQLIPGRDRIGVVTFASSAYVNFPIANDFRTSNPNIAAMLSKIDCAGSTSTAQGLWTGYQQLIGLNQPEAVNSILLITDGVPTGVTFDMPVASSSPCSQFTPGSPDGPGAYTMPSAGKGYIRGVYNTFTNFSQWFGILDQNGVAGPDGLQKIANNDLQPAPRSNGCAYYSNWPQNMMSTTDFLGVPAKDVYGNFANTSYYPVTLNSYGFIDINNPKNASAAALNAADSAATNIRDGATDPVSGRGLNNVTIYSIGIGGAPYPASPTFLERVSNDPRSPIYDATRPVGAAVSVASGAELEGAFGAVASAMLRGAGTRRQKGRGRGVEVESR